MGSVGLEILWSPVHPDKFITWGTEIYLYQISPTKEVPDSPQLKTSTTNPATLLATNSAHRYIKCIDICPQKDNDILLAVGQANGKVVLASFGSFNCDAVGREFAPLHPRQCNSVAWNPVDTNVIAVGLEKFRNEPAVSLWDAFRCPHHLTDEFHKSNIKAILETGISETANSLGWINPSCLAVGFNNKSLKIIDRRDSTKVINSTMTKAVYGINVEAHNENTLASFFENQICVWDMRNFEKPISTIIRVKPISKIFWCPTRPNRLASLQRDSSIIMLHDLQMAAVGTEDVEPTLLERAIQPISGHNITSFSWHPSCESRLLTISLSGSITDYTVAERITLNWLPCSQLIWTYGRKSLKVLKENDKLYSSMNDISVKIKKRAISNYGLKQELYKNGDLAEDEALKNLWYWLHLSRSLLEKGVVKSSSSRHPGVINVINLDGLKSRAEPLTWPDVINSAYIRTYRSEERDAALQLCGWKFERDSSALVEFVETLQARGMYSRAAAIAVFNLRLRLAIKVLTAEEENQNKQNKTSNLSVVAMALSGFTDERTSIWREHCVLSRARLTDPYLRASFAFLTAENENYDNVLNETGMAVEDRVGFACMFLNDSKLVEFLLKLTETLIDEGDLAGMLLTGASIEGAKLLQKYLDLTGDVQSVSLLAVRAFPLEIQLDPNVQNWFASYQQILDSRRLWDQRAHFDLTLNTASQCERLQQQVFVSCNFCGKSISAYIQGVSRTRAQYARVGPTNNKLKMSSCPNCRKPLPRCAICLAHMGTSLNVGEKFSDKKASDLSSWFTWCQSCRHGGHAGHVSSWFEKHIECPVTGCSCQRYFKMIRRSPTRIELKIDDLQEFERVREKLLEKKKEEEQKKQGKTRDERIGYYVRQKSLMGQP
ncbi:hypothetical protein RUM44_010950 [Polyplax serrata]|uniref:WD repeat protein mio zinc-ribbon like domain-containing protein n=1 Tax=Polyplax serrata TaxID=468196 RepID=A0ABR1APC1_POLSC